METQLKCIDCKCMFTRDKIANVNTPRCIYCHNRLIINIVLTSCSIM